MILTFLYLLKIFLRTKKRQVVSTHLLIVLNKLSEEPEFIPHKRRMEEEYLQTTLRIKYNTIEILDQLATDLDMSRNELINQCIDYALENLKKPSNNEKEKQSV